MDESTFERLAHLARIDVPEQERDALGRDLRAILSEVRRLRDAAGRVERSGGLVAEGEAQASLRPDQARPSLPRDEALRSAPEQDGEAFVVPRVLPGP